MARKSARKEVLPWASANADNIEHYGFAQIGRSLFESERFQKLGYGAGMLYLHMISHAAGKREFTFSHGDAKKHGFASSTYYLYIKKLIQGGFIIRLEDEERSQFAKARYRFSLVWKT